MKSLVITNYYPPCANAAYETRCEQVVEGLKARGHDVTVLTSDYGLDSLVGEQEGVLRRLKFQEKIRDDIELIDMGEAERHNKIVLRDEIARIDPEVIHIWNLNGFSRQFLTFIQKLKITLVYDVNDDWLLKMLKKDTLFSWWNRPSYQSRTQTPFGGSHSKGHSQDCLSRFGQSVFSTHGDLDNIYCCSAYLKSQMLNAGFDIKTAEIIPCALDSEQFELKSKYGDPKKLLWVGDFNDDHDPMTALEAFRFLIKEGHNDITLSMYSKNIDHSADKIKMFISQLDLGNQVFIKPYTLADETTFFSEHDVLLFTSVCKNPFPLIPLKAMASGLPVIAAADGGVSELIKDDFNGFTFRPRSVADLGKKVSALLKMQDSGEMFGRNGCDFVKRKLKFEEILTHIEAILVKSISYQSVE